VVEAYESAIRNFESLLAEGHKILHAAGWDGSRYNRFPCSVDYMRFRTSSLNLIRRTCGPDSDHYKGLTRLSEGDKTNSYYFAHCLGILQAAHQDFECGRLIDLRSLIAAEVLGDFVDQAQHLVESGYYPAAASLAGAVLEDTLRKMCERHGILVADKTSIDRLNSDLARQGVYEKLVMKRITGLADIRNNADHGRFDQFSREDVLDMVKWVKRFVSDVLH
jgi:hypothetical protein